MVSLKRCTSSVLALISLRTLRVSASSCCMRSLFIAAFAVEVSSVTRASCSWFSSAVTALPKRAISRCMDSSCAFASASKLSRSLTLARKALSLSRLAMYSSVTCFLSSKSKSRFSFSRFFASSNCCRCRRISLPLSRSCASCSLASPCLRESSLTSLSCSSIRSCQHSTSWCSASQLSSVCLISRSRLK